MKVKWNGTGLTPVMKERGMLYYRHNQVHVQSVEVTESCEFCFTAEVEGTDTCHVTADISETGHVSDLTCTCPYAASGNACKHMAALLHHASYWNIPKNLYRAMLLQRARLEAIRQRKMEEAMRAAEEERLRKEQAYFAVRKPIQPFSRPASAPYRYFDFGVITAPFLIYDLDYEEAQRQLQTVRVSSRIQYGYSQDDPSEDLVCAMSNFMLADLVIKRDMLLKNCCHISQCRCEGKGSFAAPGGKKALCPGSLAGLIQMQTSLIFEDYQNASAKRAACLDLIRSAMDGGHRILIFSQFTSMLTLLENDLTDAGIAWYAITGATPRQERVDLVRRFNEGDISVFLISLKAGGTGLNLTGADTVIHYDPWWNVAAQNQATDRAHRIGQTRTVCVYKLIGKDTIEEKILKLQQDKQDLADEILSGEGRSISAMSREELMALLG